MTDKEKQIVNLINHSLYTVNFLEQWIGRCDNIATNAPAALQAMSAKGFYEAVKCITYSTITQSMLDRIIIYLNWCERTGSEINIESYIEFETEEDIANNVN